MLYSKQGRILIGLMVLALAVAATVVWLGRQSPAAAQVPDMPPAMDDGQLGPPSPMHPGMMPPGGGYGGYRPMPIMGGAAAIAAAGEYVYVVQGNTLYQFSANTLKLRNKAQLATTPPPQLRFPQESPQPAPGPPGQ